MNKKIKIKLQSYDHILLDRYANKILKTALCSGSIIHGPIPLPTKKKIYTVLRSPHVNKKSREQYLLPKHRRYLEINANSITVEAMMKIELYSGVELEIKV
ncbi:MAG TPA: 30S ribosomal protein S10 [Blattabacteriaceae bacterium]